MSFSSDKDDSEDVVGDPVVVYLRVEELKDSSNSKSANSKDDTPDDGQQSDMAGLGISLKKYAYQWNFPLLVFFKNKMEAAVIIKKKWN